MYFSLDLIRKYINMHIMFSLPTSPNSLMRRALAVCVCGFLWGTIAAGNDSPGWRLVWADEFDVDGPPNPQNWTYDLGAGGWGNQEIQTYTDSLDNARVEDGRLIIEVHRDTEESRASYTSARILTRGLHSWQYGRIEFRARLPRTTGTWSAVWMLSENAIFPGAFWPDNGEIDILEHVGYEEDPLYHAARGFVPDNVHSTLHTQMRNHISSSGIGGKTRVPDATEAFNTYAINWFEDRMEFEVNGEVYMTIRKEDHIPRRNPPDELWPYWPFDQPFHLILNIAVGGMWGGVFNNSFYPDSSPYGPLGIDHQGEWPQRMEVEYVRVFEAVSDLPQWRGFPVIADDYVDTGDWLGLLYIARDPWVHSGSLGWLLLPDHSEDNAGRWIWWSRAQ